jgi:hypothetical protein
MSGTVVPTLLLATWNLRELGGAKSGGWEKEPLFYIAEIMSRFDMVAVQEARDNLDPLMTSCTFLRSCLSRLGLAGLSAEYDRKRIQAMAHLQDA